MASSPSPVSPPSAPPGVKAGGGSGVFVFGSFGGILAGYDQGIAAGSLLFLTRDLHLSPWWQGTVVSSLMAGAIVGSLVGGVASERLGRRKVLIVASIVFGVAALGMALAPGTAVLVIARVVAGLAVGTASVVVPTYLSEMAATRNRGGIATLNQLMIAIGIFIAYLSSLLLSPWGAWRWMLGLALVPSLILLFGVSRAPETPRWLVGQGRTEEARMVLTSRLGPDEAASVLAEIEQAAADERKRAAGRERARFRELFAPGLRRPLLIAAGLALLQQLIGINTIVYYAPTILHAAGFGDSAALANSVGLGALSIITTIVSARLVDRVGRRRLLMIGAVAMVVSMLLLSLLFGLGTLQSGGGAAGAVFCLALFKVAFSLSWGPVVWVLLPEQFPLRVRSVGVGAGSFLNWAGNLAVSQLFPVLLAVGAAAVFGVFAGFGVLALLFAAFVVRETAGRSLERLQLDKA